MNYFRIFQCSVHVENGATTWATTWRTGRERRGQTTGAGGRLMNNTNQSIWQLEQGKKGRVLGCWCCCWCRCAVAVDMSPVGLYNRWGIATHCCFCRLNNTTIKTQQQPNHLSQPADQQRNSPDFTARQHGQSNVADIEPISTNINVNTDQFFPLFFSIFFFYIFNWKRTQKRRTEKG